MIMRINTTDKMIGDLYHSYSASKNLSDSESVIIYSLRLFSEPLTQTRLCSMVYLSKQTVNSSLKKMEREGYISLQNAKDSKKVKLVSLTEKGEKLAENVADKIIERELSALRAMPEGKAEEFISLYALYAECLKTEFLKG